MEETINQRFKIFLETERLTQTEVAKTLQCTKQSVSLMANSKQAITIQHAVLLEREFKLSSQWLLTGYGPMLFEHNITKLEKVSIPVEMYKDLRKDLEMYRAMCAKLMGVEVPSANFNLGSLKAIGSKIIALYPSTPIQTVLDFEQGQLGLFPSMNAAHVKSA